MPQIQKIFHLSISPQQFVEACDEVELQELMLEIERKISINNKLIPTTMPRYFVKITADHWTAKNKLQQEFKAHCYTVERVVLDDFQKTEFIKDLKKKVNELNEKHNRCKPLDFHTFRTDKTSEAVGVIGVSHITLFKER